MLVTLLLASAGASPWAESPGLLVKATDPSFTAVQSAPVILHRDFWNPWPRPDAAVLPGSWSVAGQAAPTLRPPSLDSIQSMVFGNEIGDELFRELKACDGENRTPAMIFNFATPRFHGARASLYFDQTDHFSDGKMDVRDKLAGNPAIFGRLSPSVRRAFFGENLPDQSFIGGALDGGDLLPAEAAWRTGWVWLPSPAAGMLEGWQTASVRGGLRWKQLSWEHSETRMERADTSTGSLLETKGSISLGLGDTSLSGRFGFDYSHVHREGNGAWHPGTGLMADPWASFGLSRSSWSFGGMHRGGSIVLLADSLQWTPQPGPWNLLARLSSRWTDRPEGAATDSDSSAAGWAVRNCRALEGSWALRTGVSRESGGWSVGLATEPWWIYHPHAFSATGYDTVAGSWIVRAGHETSLPGVLWGWKTRAAVACSLSAGLSADASLQIDPVLGGPQSRTDLTAPLWGTSFGIRARHRCGLSVRPLLLWRDEAILRHRSSQDWTVPAGPDFSLWIDQDFFHDRLTLSMAALNILSNDPCETPQASEDRARLLVKISARL